MNLAPPAALGPFATLPRWVVWRNERRGDDVTKVPYTPHRPQQKARADDPSTWGDWRDANDAATLLVNGSGGGVGIELGDLGDGDALGGVDLDTCLDEHGAIAPWAQEVIDRLSTYAEVSPSVTGVKLYYRYRIADLPALRAAMKTDFGRLWKRSGGAHPPAIELHVGNRYFAWTGKQVPETPSEIRPVSLDTLLWLIKEAGPRFAGSASSEQRSSSTDQSRSAIAFRKGQALRRAGASFEEMCSALRNDPETADWVREKGGANDGRELHRIWERGEDSDDGDALDREMLENPDMGVLRLGRRLPPQFPLSILGKQWSAWVQTAADAAACPIDNVVAPLLASVSVLVGHARWAEAVPGWSEPPHLWCGVVGDSGTGKSPGSDALLRDILPELEQRMLGDFPDRLAQWRADSEAHTAALEIWRTEVRTASKMGSAPPMPPSAEPPPEPQAPRLRQTDVTIERLATLLASAAPKGVLVTRDELAGWLLGMNAYSDAGRAFWIESYGGRPYRVERQKSPLPIVVPRLAVAVTGGTQPEKLAQLFRDADDGLLARIAWFWPDPLPKFRLGRAVPEIGWAAAALDRLRLLDLQPAVEPGGGTRPVLVPLSSAAVALVEEFGQEMQDQQQQAGGLLRSAVGKARGLALRLSLVIEFLWWCGHEGMQAPPTFISEQAFSVAAALASDYLLPMAERVYGDAAARPVDRNAATLARWIMKTKSAEVHVRNLQRAVRLPGLGTAEVIRDAAAVLVEAGWLIPPKVGFGKQRKVSYVVNQRIFEVAL